MPAESAALFISLYLDEDVYGRLPALLRAEGIIVTEQSGIGEVLRRLLALLDSVTADEMKNTFRYLSDFADHA